MVTIKDGCGCNPCDCDWKQKLKEAYSRAIQSVNKIGDNDGSVYFPDGTGFVKLPLPRQSDVAQIYTNTEDIANLKAQDIQLQANITTEETARKAKDELLDADITRIDNTDAGQDQRIQDNADRINSTYNELVTTEATVATHNSEIITLKANNQALAKSLVSDVLMSDGTAAGSVQVSIKREDGSLITSANYRWGKDIGIRLEAGTQEGYIKVVISLSDGTELVSNEYKIVEVLESDVYVTAITLIADQAAGTLGGNISYSNGTTQTINSVSVPTAPGVTSAIETLQGRMAAVEQKNANQDASITAIDGRVQALENTPGIGQFANGRLGTIAGSTTDGRIKAESDGTGSVNGWNDLKSRVTAAEGQIVAVQNDKINVAQGVENAGKVLGINASGNVEPTEVSSGGEVWEPINLSNIPTDWTENDRVKIQFYKIDDAGTTPSSWTSPITKPSVVTTGTPSNTIYEFSLKSSSPGYIITGISTRTEYVALFQVMCKSYSEFNSGNAFVIYSITTFNATGKQFGSYIVNKSEAAARIYKMWRLKQ